jgi:tetratricopeptide (TPR) repeat protein
MRSEHFFTAGVPMKAVAAALVLLLSPSLYAQGSDRAGRRVVQYPESAPVSDWPAEYPAIPRTTPSVTKPEAIKPVSVSELLVPEKASKEVQRSEKSLRSGDVRGSAEHLEKAIQIYPDYLQAHNLLGTRYMSLGEYPQAVAEFQKAAAIDPNLAPTYLSLSVAFFFAGHYADAEIAGRRALELDPESAGTRYVLGRSLIQQGKGTPEALELLRQSEGAFPNARLVLALVLSERGETPQVIAELGQYVKEAPVDPENKRRAACWLAQLTQAPLPAGCPAGSTRPNFR